MRDRSHRWNCSGGRRRACAAPWCRASRTWMAERASACLSLARPFRLGTR